ncbi:MAG TPA: NfeD family protein [Burkholderiales bacterium]|nr:NfeD family protein [Burkholderiales bacterium]
MDISLAWLIAGFILIIAELVSGTFYLLVLGIAALVASGVGYASGAFVWQAVAAAVVAVAGVVGVHRYRQTITPGRMRGLDVGQPAAFESWINKGTGHARVRYRDALWDAQISGEASCEPGEILYVTAVDGSTLKVSKTRPA